MKIEKLMSIERFLEIGQIALRIYTEEDKKQLEEYLSETIQKSQFEPIDNPLGFPNYYNGNSHTGFQEYDRSFFMWIYKGYVYAPKDVLKKDMEELHRDPLSKEHISLLILELYDKERKQFERLKNLYSASSDEHAGYKRPSIPEKTRIEVWRRDEGKCVDCGSKEKLEYDHIIPISKGGSNTARNIELRCEKCNRSKGAKIG